MLNWDLCSFLFSMRNESQDTKPSKVEEVKYFDKRIIFKNPIYSVIKVELNCRC